MLNLLDDVTHMRGRRRSMFRSLLVIGASVSLRAAFLIVSNEYGLSFILFLLGDNWVNSSLLLSRILREELGIVDAFSVAAFSES